MVSVPATKPSDAVALTVSVAVAVLPAPMRHLLDCADRLASRRERKRSGKRARGSGSSHGSRQGDAAAQGEALSE